MRCLLQPVEDAEKPVIKKSAAKAAKKARRRASKAAAVCSNGPELSTDSEAATAEAAALEAAAIGTSGAATIPAKRGSPGAAYKGCTGWGEADDISEAEAGPSDLAEWMLCPITKVMSIS